MIRKLLEHSRGRSISVLLTRLWSGANSNVIYSEQDLKKTLTSKFPKAANINVTDISGGCGAMFEVLIESTEFKGMPIVKQHRMVTESLKTEIKDMHGVRIHTAIPSENGG